MKAKKLLINLTVFLISGFVIFYIIIQLVSNLSRDVSFQHASLLDVEDTLEKTCYLVRNESVLYADQTGVTTYSVSESQKVGSDQLIATVFSDSRGVDIQKQIQDIDEKIAILERSSVDTSYLTSDISKIDGKIHNSLVKLHLAVVQNKIGLSEQHQEELLINFNKRRVITSNDEGFESQIQALKNEKESLTASLQNPLCSVHTQKSGYFSTLLDGYETKFTPEVLKDLTVDSYHELIAQTPNEKDSNAIGKVITDFDWHTLCEVSSAEAERFVVGKNYNLTFLYSSGQQISSRLERKISQTDTDAVVLVFVVEEVPQDFDYTRKQTVRIVMDTTKGLAFPLSALRIVDGVQGVYIIDGNSVGFRKVDIVYASGSQYYSREKKNGDQDAKSYLGRYDRVITEGKDLYVGKILD